ncbi:unnamed protein product [Mesocestoides corti]|uniref:DUF7041 domain-containing protein n=1 Tax=Mesocestoides corti TaxID=53468 RepID=A0A0R3U8Q9_MESCO|nr:unnamed protein product [Mesocestoides corti]
MSGDKDKDKASQSCDTPLDLPPFSQVDVVGWFNAVEQRFQLHNITCQKTMYCLVTPLLPPLVASSVADLIDEAPAENPYDTLKAAIIAKWTASSELALVPYQPPRAEVGNVKPSQLFWQLLHGVGQNTAQKLALRRSWAQHLPMDMRDGVQLAADANMTLEKLLNIVDNIHHWLATANKPKWALCRSQGQVDGVVACSPIPKRFVSREATMTGRAIVVFVLAADLDFVAPHADIRMSLNNLATRRTARQKMINRRDNTTMLVTTPT